MAATMKLDFLWELWHSERDDEYLVLAEGDLDRALGSEGLFPCGTRWAHRERGKTLSEILRRPPHGWEGPRDSGFIARLGLETRFTDRFLTHGPDDPCDSAAQKLNLPRQSVRRP
ncbi:MAG: hypothetical protein HY721_05785 [Planctomycetes bacterium]|nr:hypothetical protein [Planctomycetota bacterium]